MIPVFTGSNPVSPWKEVRIIIKCVGVDYPYNLFLCFQNEKEYIDNFRIPLESAKELNDGDVVILRASQGMIEVARHFTKDYSKDSVFEVTIDKNVKINKATLAFEEDNSVKPKYDNFFMKNIEIKFKNIDCISFE